MRGILNGVLSIAAQSVHSPPSPLRLLQCGVRPGQRREADRNLSNLWAPAAQGEKHVISRTPRIRVDLAGDAELVEVTR